MIEGHGRKPFHWGDRTFLFSLFYLQFGSFSIRKPRTGEGGPSRFGSEGTQSQIK